MKHSKILNRPMFNAQNSAYGRGITSNLVSEEQRQRFNDGGRVGLYWGGAAISGAGKILPWARQALPKMWSKIKPTRIPKNIVTKQSSTQPIGMRGTMGSRTTTTPRSTWQMAKEFTKENPWWVGGGALAGYNAPTTWEGIKGAGKLVKAGAKQLGDLAVPDWIYDQDKHEEEIAARKKAEAVEDTPSLNLKKNREKPTEVMETDTLDWTDQEKKEKMGQIQLKLAQRLVSGAADKWGSKAQMKNVGDWFGDVAAIGDKTELRKDDRKYKAWGKQQRKTADAAHDRLNSYVGLIEQNVSHPEALYRTTGIPGALSLPADKDGQEKVGEEIAARGPGTIYFDESENTWMLTGPDGKPIVVTVDKIEEAFKSGAIEKLRGLPAKA